LEKVFLNTDTFIVESKKINGDLYDYSLVNYINTNTEEKIKLFLDNKNIIYNKEHKFKSCRYKQPLKFDFYLPEHNICIEYDGEQHFKKYHKWENNDDDLTLRKIRDQIKTNYCKNNNIKLIRIPYTELKNIDFILTEKLKNN
jgi:very-short-patch-repair endonuclease